MKKIFLSIFLLCLTIFVAACSGVATEPNSPTTPTTPTTTTPTTFESFCTAYNNIIKNDNNIAAEISSNKDCEFAGYSTKVVEENNGTLNLYGKVFNNSRSYCFYITMTYNNVELNNIFTQNKTKAEWYANLENFIKATNYDTCVENKVINFTELNNAAKKYVPATTSEVMGSLNAVDIKALDEFYYDSEFNNYKFNIYTENIYTYTTGGFCYFNANCEFHNYTPVSLESVKYWYRD